jgi:hypothetical protein
MPEINTSYKLPNFPHTSRIHPITGVEHNPCDTGYEPPIDSFPSDDLKRWKSMVIDIPRDDVERARFNDMMARVAKSFSEMTGNEVLWHNIKDSCCNIFGDYGFFIVRRK